jgi:predicted component of type VI protein secretion system
VIVTATDLANDSKGVIDRVLSRRETAEIQRHGKAVAQLRRKVGVGKKELAEILNSVRWTAAESAKLKAAANEAAKVIGYAGRA